ncbi:MAG: DUF5677 domain-containing protein [Patescibacteria group bacterium]|nr:DUF5677 domain-containing protein [Patescibacteria group bacterium]
MLTTTFRIEKYFRKLIFFFIFIEGNMEIRQQKFGSNELLNSMRNYLSAEMTLVRGIIETRQLQNRSLSIMAMIGSLLGTGNAILLLMKENQRFYNEGIMLARGFFERITNVCYLLLCDEDTFFKCTQHTIFRQYARGKENGKVVKDENDNVLMKIELSFKGIEKIEDNSLIKEAIDSFEKDNKYKFPIPKIEKRLGFLLKQNKTINVSLFLAYQQAYYDDASEALHGSFYGSLFHVLNIGLKEKNAIEEETNKNTTLLLWQTSELFHQLIVLLSEINNMNDFREKSDHNSKTTLGIMRAAVNGTVEEKIK